MIETKPIAQSKNFIILDKYTKIDQSDSRNGEANLENKKLL